MKRCNVAEVEAALKNARDCQVVDVRELFEFQAEHIEGTLLLPLSKLAQEAPQKVDKNKKIYLLCRSGARACNAADQLTALGVADLYVLEGGLQAWSRAGKPVVRGSSRVWALDRQVRFAAGSLVLTGILLGWAVHPYWIGLSLFVGAGLVFSGITNTCGMAIILSKMPWNKPKENA